MAVRNTPALRIPGDPLGGVLRQTARMARRSARRGPTTQGPQGEPGPVGPPGPPAHATGVPVAAVAELTTDDTGVSEWRHGVTDRALLVTATATGDVPVIVTVRQTDAGTATLYAWTVTGQPATGATLVATAFERSAPVPQDID